MTIPGPKIRGLDLMIDGPIPMVARHGETPQTSILIRGEAGTGKTVLATYLASLFAGQFGADAVYACIELLPTELAAQASGLYVQTPMQHVVTDWSQPPSEGLPNFWAGMLDLGSKEHPAETRARFQSEFIELIQAARVHSTRGVRVVVIDSMSASYGLGATAPRVFVDDITKFAATEGLVLIVIEELDAGKQSPWPFAVDMVMELSNEPSPDGERTLRVPKNRFGPSLGGLGAGFSVEAERGPVIRPPVAAYVRRDPVVPPTARQPQPWPLVGVEGVEKLGPFEDAVIEARMEWGGAIWFIEETANYYVVEFGEKLANRTFPQVETTGGTPLATGRVLDNLRHQLESRIAETFFVVGAFSTHCTEANPAAAETLIQCIRMCKGAARPTLVCSDLVHTLALIGLMTAHLRVTSSGGVEKAKLRDLRTKAEVLVSRRAS